MYDFKNIEPEILKFWQKERIYEKSRKRNAKGKRFYLMDGPPYATGHIHMGTALNKILKDVAMRSKRLQGYDVFDRAGYDTHGLPIEFQIEKEIGSKSKSDIEKYGIKKFVGKCKEFATRFIDVMNSEFEDLGVWMDFENPYLTLEPTYVEAIWDTFKVADEKGLLYLDKYPVHVCPRCETAVAYNEIEYGRQEDTSIFVKFPLKGRKNTFLIIWTTTPWTLPGNTGVMVHPDFVYQEIEISNGERWIIAKALASKIMAQLGLEYTLKNEYKGKEMEEWEYENPLSRHLNLKIKNAYKIVLSGRHVHLEEGTGLVHCAPGHGKEDYEVGKEYGLDMPSPVEINGLLSEEAGKYFGKRARVVDEEIMQDLEKEGFLIYKMKYPHDYPLCWRCKSPLLMISQPQWFLKISSIHQKLIEENDATTWIPSWMKLRMKSWLEGVSDWPVSRKRYWGTPLPIWICGECNARRVVGSIKELEKLSGKRVKEVHKPEIDEIKIKCKCGGGMKRVSEVLDVWFDSGVSSWAALNYPQEKGKFKEFWPAELNIEGKDQIRGWWNSQLILSVIRFGKKPFENIAVHGMVLDLGKKKMSKSLGNVTSPQDLIEKFGRDYLRYYFTRVSKGEDFAFDEKEFLDIQKAITVLNNVNNLVNQTENNVNNFVNQTEKRESMLKIEDKWILSRFNSLVKDVSDCYNKFRFPEVIQALERFLIFDLSRTYIQMIRERRDEVYEILNKIRIGLIKLFAPVIPFLTESIWQELKERGIVKDESIHLSEWPKSNEKMIDKRLEESMEIVKGIIEKALAERAKAGIGVRWPLASLRVFTKKENFDAVKKLEDIIKSQLNVKAVLLKESGEERAKIDIKMTKELEAEGFAREIARYVQDARKKAGLVKKQKISLVLQTDELLAKMLEKFEEFLKGRVGASKLTIKGIEEKIASKHKTEVEVRGKKIVINFDIG